MPISFNFSPLAALVLGILIGFIIEWFLELLYFRRQRRGSEERLARAEADLQERSRDLLATRTQADALRSDLSTVKARVTSLQAELQACQAATAEARGQASSLQTQLHNTTTQVSGLQSGRQDVDARLTAALGELEMLRAQVGDANTRRDSLDAALQAREAAYQSLDAALAESRTHEAALQDEISRLRADFQARDASLGAAQGDLDSLRRQLNETTARRDSLDSVLQARDAAYRALEAALAESRTHEAALQDQLASLRADWPAQIPALEEADSLRSQLASAASHPKAAAADVRTANVQAELAADGSRSAPFGQQESTISGLAGLGAGLAAGGAVFSGAADQKAHMTACPQDLSKVQGVGQSYEAKLYAAGIGSFWELANADDEELRRIFGIKGFQKVDLAAIKADARRLAEATNSIGRGWDGSAPDDFETMEGIGAVFEGQLYDAGICTNRALADASEEQLAQICPTPAWRRPNYADWIRQAKARLGEA